MIDNDFLLHFPQQFRRCHQFGDMRVHNNDHRLIRHEAFCLALINKKPFRQAAGLYSLDHFPGRIILFGNDDVRFHLGHSRQVGNTYRGPKRVKIFIMRTISASLMISRSACATTRTRTRVLLTEAGALPPKAFTSFPRRTMA